MEKVISSQVFYEVSLKSKYICKLDQQRITSATSAFYLLRQFIEANEFDLYSQEHFFCLFLDRNNNVLGVACPFIGGVSGVVADMKIVYRMALLAGASCIILSHNHPSGNLNFSDADIHLTKQYKKIAKVIGIDCLDHVLIGHLDSDKPYLSMREEGLF